MSSDAFQKFRCFLVVSLLLLLAAACDDRVHRNDSSLMEQTPSSSSQSSKQSEYIIVLKEGIEIEAVVETLTKYGGRTIRDLGRGRYLVSLALDPGIDALQQDPELIKGILSIQPNHRYSIQPE